jgi:hypothetical protein
MPATITMVEGMGGCRLTRVGKVANQEECDDAADGGASSAHTAYRGNRFTLEKIRRQNVGNSRKCSIGKRCRGKKPGNRP